MFDSNIRAIDKECSHRKEIRILMFRASAGRCPKWLGWGWGGGGGGGGSGEFLMMKYYY